MAVKERQSETSFDEIEWNVENEIQLFFAMNGHKPVGKTSKPAMGGYVSRDLASMGDLDQTPVNLISDSNFD